MPPILLPLEPHLASEPGQRNARLHLPQRFQREAGGIGFAAERGRQHAVGADEIAALAQRFAGEADRLDVVAADILAIGGDAAIDRGTGIARLKRSACLAAASPSCQRPR